MSSRLFKERKEGRERERERETKRKTTWPRREREMGRKV
jgi:hypothetical protein